MGNIAKMEAATHGAELGLRAMTVHKGLVKRGMGGLHGVSDCMKNVSRLRFGNECRA